MQIYHQNDWNASQQFQSDLMPDESVLWTGRPDPSIIFSKGDIFLIPFSLIWGGGVIFGEVNLLKLFFEGKAGPSPRLFLIFGIAFIAVGLYVMIGRFFYKKWKKQHTYYAVTEKRVLILTTGWYRQLKAASIDNLPSIEKSTGKNGTGNVIFGNSTFGDGIYLNSGMDFVSANRKNFPAAFFDIKDADAVYVLVSRLMAEAKAGISKNQ